MAEGKIENIVDTSKGKVVETPIVWRDPETDRPKQGEKIIFEDTVGMFSGIFSTFGNGKVWVEGSKDDMVMWEDVFNWIPYPQER